MNSEQLELALPWGRHQPWEARSPRVLTRAYRAFSFRAEGMGRLDLDAPHAGDTEQEQLGQLLFPFGGYSLKRR